ncbi:cytochrome o ubiquinol oxidase subunit IV [Buchnera aphidicola]|uniref:cytochrome o ubiquinol oxidase subunit IV n=1 Tax=Buchnera aphidicola TaxID=9 RepID=UPI0034641005
MKNIIKYYVLGCMFSFILTVLPFLLVSTNCFDKSELYFIISFCAIMQIVLHFKYFLHLNTSIENRWNLIAVLFSTVIIFIIIFGSSWIMSNLNSHLMKN